MRYGIGDDVDAGHEGAGRVVGHPVGGGVVDEVAGGAAQAEQLGLGLSPVADGGRVLVAVGVDLAGAHDYVTPTRPDDIEYVAVRHPGLDEPLGIVVAHRDRVGGQYRHGVSHHHGRFEGGAGQAPTDDRRGPDRVAEDLAVSPEGFGDGHCTDLIASCWSVDLVAPVDVFVHVRPLPPWRRAAQGTRHGWEPPATAPRRPARPRGPGRWPRRPSERLHRGRSRVDTR